MIRRERRGNNMGKERGGGNNVVRSERKGEERERETRWCGRERERRVQGGVRREREEYKVV